MPLFAPSLRDVPDRRDPASAARNAAARARAGASRGTLAGRVRDARAAAVGRRAEPIRRRSAFRGRAGGRLVGQLRRPGAVGPHPPRGAREPRRARSPPSACARRAPARRSAARGCCRASASSAAASIARTGYGAADQASAVPGHEGLASAASTSRGRSTSPAACARAPRRPPPTTLAAEHGARGVRLLVLTDVATNYFTLVGALRQLDTVRAISAAQDETLRLVTARQRAGLATPFDVERAQTDASRARAAIPPLETLAAVSRHRIAVLIGDQAFNAASIVPCDAASSPFRPRAPGQPAALLRAPARPARREGAARRRQRAPAAGARRNGSRGSSSARCSAARASS